jgi:futalosine hydrolase
MKILIVAATQMELNLLTEDLKGYSSSAENKSYIINSKEIKLCITGVGMASAAYALTKELCNNQYDIVIQAGVGGSFDKSISLGSVVKVRSEQYGDLGAEDHNNYLDIMDMGLIEQNSYPFSNSKLINPGNNLYNSLQLPEVHSLSVNRVSGNERTIERLKTEFNCQVESMEGIALHYVCLQEHIPFIQLRSISNYVIPRDKSQWQMKEAIIALNNCLIEIINMA